jgi:hypothetical protein
MIHAGNSQWISTTYRAILNPRQKYPGVPTTLTRSRCVPVVVVRRRDRGNVASFPPILRVYTGTWTETGSTKEAYGKRSSKQMRNATYKSALDEAGSRESLCECDSSKKGSTEASTSTSCATEAQIDEYCETKAPALIMKTQGIG